MTKLVKLTEDLSQEAIFMQNDYKAETGKDINMPDAIILLLYKKNLELQDLLSFYISNTKQGAPDETQ